MVFDTRLDKPHWVWHVITSAKPFLAAIEWKRNLHVLCKDPRKGPHHNVGHCDGMALRRTLWSLAVLEQHSLTAAQLDWQQYPVNSHELKCPASSLTGMALNVWQSPTIRIRCTILHLLQGPVTSSNDIGCSSSQHTFPTGGDDRQLV